MYTYSHGKASVFATVRGYLATLFEPVDSPDWRPKTGANLAAIIVTAPTLTMAEIYTVGVAPMFNPIASNWQIPG